MVNLLVGTNSFVAGRDTKKKSICACIFLTVFLLFGSNIPTDISNPNYVGMAAFSQLPPATSQLKQIPSPDQPPSLWSYEQQPKETTSVIGQSQSSSSSPSLSPLSPKPSLQPPLNRSSCSRSQEYLWVFEFWLGLVLSPLSFCTVTMSLSVQRVQSAAYSSNFSSIELDKWRSQVQTSHTERKLV